MYVSDLIIPARFLCTAAQLVFTLALLDDRAPHVIAALPPAARQNRAASSTSTDFADFDAEFHSALSLTVVCSLFETVSIVLIGSTLLLDRVCFAQFLIHCCGAVSIAVFGLSGDAHFAYFWWIAVLFGVLPVLFELAALWYLRNTKIHGSYF
eukprot:g8582.t1